MVRFDEIRDTLLTYAEPLDACKALTERANQAGGHDNITVVIVRFDGEALPDPSVEGEPLKYRKYPLPEEISEQTSPTRRIPSLNPSAPPSANSNALASRSDPAPSPERAGWQEHTPGGTQQQFDIDEPIDIPGTHVPTYIVVGLIMVVVVLLSATAFLFLR
jgi:protein phosphatase